MHGKASNTWRENSLAWLGSCRSETRAGRMILERGSCPWVMYRPSLLGLSVPLETNSSHPQLRFPPGPHQAAPGDVIAQSMVIDSALCPEQLGPAIARGTSASDVYALMSICPGIRHCSPGIYDLRTPLSLRCVDSLTFTTSRLSLFFWTDSLCHVFPSAIGPAAGSLQTVQPRRAPGRGPGGDCHRG